MSLIDPASPSLAGPLILQPNSDHRSWQHRYCQWLLVSNVVIVIAVLVLAQALRFGNVTRGSLGGYASIDYVFVSVTIGLGWAAALAIYRTHSKRVV